MSLEGSIDFLVLLVSKLWPNNANQLGKSPLIPYAGEFLKYLEFLVITLEPETLESRSNAVKIRIIA